MVDERDDKYDGQEEGEYHFSDDHSAYETDTETTKVADATVAKSSSGVSGVNRYRRVLIAGGVFIVLMFVVYKMVAPTGTPSTDISTQVASTANSTQRVTTTTSRTTVVAQQAPAVAAQPVQQQPQQQQPAVMAQAAFPQQPANTMQAQPIVQPAPQPAPMMAQQQPAPTMQMPQQGPTMQPPTGGVVTYAQSDTNKEIVDRLAALEQQNAKLTNVLQIEYAQKMADYENQSVALQAKLKELATRVAGMEAALNQSGQIQVGPSKQIAMSTSASASMLSGPKQNYTVQAIIPGRAWLKSDAGDTVTVAEGDVLRDYGRITKIDPYDGVVNIDTGNKVVSLSYGAGGDS